MAARPPMDMKDALDVQVLCRWLNTNADLKALDKTPEGRRLTNAIDRLGDRAATVRMRAFNDREAAASEDRTCFGRELHRWSEPTRPTVGPYTGKNVKACSTCGRVTEVK